MDVDKKMLLPEDVPSSLPAPGIKALNGTNKSHESSSLPNNDINGSVRESEYSRSGDAYELDHSEPLL
jgi:hypothetical protein